MSESKAGNGKDEKTRAGEPDVERPLKLPPENDHDAPTTSEEADGADGDTRLEKSKPTLLVCVVHFHPGDRKHAVELGGYLYDTLTRPRDEPLAFGAGVPVLIAVEPDQVDLQAARDVVVVCALGNRSANDQSARQAAISKMHEWSSEPNNATVLPVPFTENWRDFEDDMHGVALLTELYADDSPRLATLISITRAVAGKLAEGEKPPRLFVSHAKADLKSTKNAAKKIATYVGTNPGDCFFDSCHLTPGNDLTTQLKAHLGHRAVFVCVRSDAYSSRAWCLKEILDAKRNFLPVLTLEVVKKGEYRTTSFVGNSPTMVWKNSDSFMAQRVVLRALVEWVKARLFEAEATRVHAIGGLPDLEAYNRPPELLDLAHRHGTELIMYPDPELPVPERQMLARANKRAHLITPTSAYRYLSPEAEPQEHVITPLDGRQISISLSNSPDVDGPEGYTHDHLTDAVTYVTRCLISAGAHVAYGGDFRKAGFTPLFVELIRSYSQSALHKPERLFSYLGAPIDPDDESVGSINAYYMREKYTDAEPAEGEQKKRPMIPWPDPSVPFGLYFSDMRRVMADRVFAAVLIGGNTRPKTDANDKDGYGGRYPGVVEEAWRMLEAEDGPKPLYVNGGFGGAGKVVADLLEGLDNPEPLRDETWGSNQHFQSVKAETDDHPQRKALGLPKTMGELGDQIRKLAEPLLESDTASVDWNGLTIAQNKALFRSRDPVEIAGLVLKGLLIRSRKAAEGKLSVELVRGDVLAAQGIDAVSVPVYEGVPLGGAAGAVDEALSGALHRAQSADQTVMAVKTTELAANWVHLAELVPKAGAGGVPFDVQAAAKDVVDQAHRFGFRRLGIVLYGGSVLDKDSGVNDAVDAMLEQLVELSSFANISWYEANDERADAIEKRLSDELWQEKVQLTVRQGEPLSAKARDAHPRRTVLMAKLNKHQTMLTTLLLPPGGNGIARAADQPTTPAEIDALMAGEGSAGRSVPEWAALKTRGAEVAKLLLGDHADEFLKQIGATGLQITHNVGASRIPFETLATAAEPAVVTRVAVNRRLMIDGAEPRELYARVPSPGKPRALLIIDPRNDLSGAADEGKIVKEYLDEFAVVTPLQGDQATRAAVLQELPVNHIVHYCGHAFYEGPGLDDSGLCLANMEELTLRDLLTLRTLPRLAFFNACEAGRVRTADRPASAPPTGEETAAFAEYFLRGGVEAYVGTHWFVGDWAAQQFAAEMYARLHDGATVSDAVQAARARLHDAKKKDWANYILFGEGDFALKGGH